MEKEVTKKKKTVAKAALVEKKAPKAAKSSSDLKADMYTQTGTKAGSIALPEDIFGASWNPDLVHQVVTSMQLSGRANTAHTKNRGEVRGGGKKPWQQKGTGRARHGSTRSPIWVGGGVAHGPRNDRNYDRKVNKKMKGVALRSIITRKFKDNEVIFVDSITFAEPKTVSAKGVLQSLAAVKGYERLMGKKVNAGLIALNIKDRTVEKSFNNFGSVEVIESRNLNPLNVLNHKFLVIVNPEESFKHLTA